MKALLSVIAQSASQCLALAYHGRSEWPLIACAVALVVLTVVVLYLWNTLRKARVGESGGSSKDLFSELCEVHELNRLERSLIAQLAGTYELPQPGTVFVDPWALDQAAAAPGPEAHRYAALRQKLFGSLE